MTAQISEILHYQRRKQRVCTEPLGDYFELAGIEPRFEVSCTALCRGYLGWQLPISFDNYKVSLKPEAA